MLPSFLKFTSSNKHKSDVFDCFKQFKQKYETLDRLIRHIKIRRFRTDNGGEHSSQEMTDSLFQHGITHELTVPGKPPTKRRVRAARGNHLGESGVFPQTCRLPDQILARNGQNRQLYPNAEPSNACTNYAVRSLARRASQIFSPPYSRYEMLGHSMTPEQGNRQRNRMQTPRLRRW
jgi:hypothetical protein